MNTNNVDKKSVDVLPSPCHHRRRKVLVAGLIFLLGVLFGGAMTVGVGVHCLRYAIKHPEAMPARITARLTRKLDLSAEQRTRVGTILEDGQKSLMAIRSEVHPRVQSELDRIADDIADVLNDQQRQQWESLFEKLRQKWAPALPDSDNAAEKIQ